MKGIRSLHLLLVHLFLVLGGGVLVLLVLGDEVVHVGLGFSELHFIHTFTSVPVEEGLAAEHEGELFRHALEHLLDGGGVTNEGGGHLEALRRDVTDGRLDVVGDPFHKVRRVLVLDVEHLFIDFLGGHATTEHGGSGEVATMTRVGGAHHVLGIEHLLSKLRDGQGAVLLRATRSQRSETSHEKVKTREGDQVHGQLAEVRVELTREAQAAGDTRHGGRHQVVKITIGRGSELEGTEADIVQGFVVNDHDFIRVLDQLMDRQSGVVRFDHGIRHLGGREDGEGAHHAVRVFFADLGDQQSSHTRTSTTTERVGDLETLEAIARFGFLADNVQHGVDQFSTFGVVTLGPVVTSTRLTKDKVVRAEDLTERTSADRVHRTRFEIHQDGTRDITATGGFVEVHVDAFQLQIGVTMVGTSRVNTMLVADDFPKLGTNLVTALPSLNMNDFTPATREKKINSELYEETL